jgi:hypothetical protein
MARWDWCYRGPCYRPRALWRLTRRCAGVQSGGRCYLVGSNENDVKQVLDKLCYTKKDERQLENTYPLPDGQNQAYPPSGSVRFLLSKFTENIINS